MQLQNFSPKFTPGPSFTSLLTYFLHLESNFCNLGKFGMLIEYGTLKLNLEKKK